MTRFRYALLAAFALATLVASAAPATAAGRPDIVLILVDDLGWGDLSCQGAEDMRTPHIDSLFERGMRFDRFYANCCVCSPTRAALLTGRYPDLVGVPGVIRTHAANSWGYLDPDAIFLPAVLRRAGYHTGMVGKWHLGLSEPNRPIDRGFDSFRGFLGDMMDDYVHHRRHGLNYMRHDDEVIDPEGHATDLFSDWAVESIERHADSPAPFFLYLAYNAPHTPIQPPAEWVERVTEREPGISPKRARLVAFIEHLDAGVGRVLDALERTDRERNALVAFTSDNGGLLRVGANNGPLRDGKGSLYEGGLRVPAAVTWPDRIEPGRSERPALTMDLFPTLVAAAGLPPVPGIEGRSLLPLLRGEEAPWPQRDLFFVRREGNRYGGQAIRAVRRGPWKLLQNTPWEPLELYHLEDDPLEENDLARERRDIARELHAALRHQIRRAGAVPWQPQGF